MSENELGRASSPYLLQHADNPVHWKIWGEDVFARAQKEDKPILLSIGYAACHWCHVMAHESFEDQESADMMNELFINIKVDREEHPDVDHIYQKALSVLGQPGGWPLTMFLTPSGQPFWGGTYFPKTPLYGRPSFKDVLATISKVYHTQKNDIAQNVSAISDALDDMTKPKGDGSLSVKACVDILNFFHRNLDPLYGGLQGAPKFPQPVLFDFLWRANWLKKDKGIDDLIFLTLEKMCLGGIYDHLGGGFARYSTDEEWLAPHFEKMLYDNALLVSLLSMVWRKHQSPLFKRSIFETIDWVFAELTIETPNGPCFASALDADSEGEEGKFYVWQEKEINDLLKEDAPLFKQAYDISLHGNWEEKNILRRVTPFKDIEEENKLTALRRKLYEVRKNRIAPQRDDKVLVDWNAMMIKALCEAAMVFDQAQWIERAQSCFNNLIKTVSKDGQLHHSWCKGQFGPTAYLEDYAHLCLAALALYEATGKKDYLLQTEKWVDHLNNTFWDEPHQGYYQKAGQTVEGLNVRPLPIQDSATPAGNGLMSHVLGDLYHLTGKSAYGECFQQLIKTFASNNPNEIFSMPCLCAGFLRFEKMQTLAIIGNSQEKEFNILKNISYLSSSPYQKILLEDGLDPQNQPEILQGKTMIDGKATIYLCQGNSCSAPITDAEELKAQLKE